MLQNQLSSPTQDLDFLKTVQDPELASKKQSAVDVMCQDQEGAYYIVEMQVASQTGFEARAQYYASKAYISQMNQADQYKALKEVIFLAIADYLVFPTKKAYKSEHCTLDGQTGENDLDKIFFTFVELPKFEELLKQEGRSLQELTLEEKWYYFLLHAPLTTDEELSVLSACLEIKAAYEALNYHGLSDREQRSYDLAEKSRLDEIAILDKLQEEATQKGREEGRKEGIEIGVRHDVSRCKFSCDTRRHQESAHITR